jgi:hypothetical protein
VSELDDLRGECEALIEQLGDCRRKFEVQREHYELALRQLRDEVSELRAALANRVG